MTNWVILCHKWWWPHVNVPGISPSPLVLSHVDLRTFDLCFLAWSIYILYSYWWTAFFWCSLSSIKGINSPLKQEVIFICKCLWNLISHFLVLIIVLSRIIGYPTGRKYFDMVVHSIVAAFWLTGSAYLIQYQSTFICFCIYTMHYGFGDKTVKHLVPGLKLLLCLLDKDVLKCKNWCIAPTYINSHGQSSPNKTWYNILFS